MSERSERARHQLVSVDLVTQWESTYRCSCGATGHGSRRRQGPRKRFVSAETAARENWKAHVTNAVRRVQASAS